MTTDTNSNQTSNQTLDDVLAKHGAQVTLDALLGDYADITQQEAERKRAAEEAAREEQEAAEREANARLQAQLATLLREGLGDALYEMLAHEAELTVREGPDMRLGYVNPRVSLPRATFTLRYHDAARDKTARTDFTLLPTNAPHRHPGIELQVTLLREEGTWQGARQFTSLIEPLPISAFRERLPRVLAAQWQRLQAYCAGELPVADNPVTREKPELLRDYLRALAVLERAALQRAESVLSWHGLGQDTPRCEGHDVGRNRVLEMRPPIAQVSGVVQATSLTVEMHREAGTILLQRVERPSSKRAKVRQFYLNADEFATIVNEWTTQRDRAIAAANAPVHEAAAAAQQAEVAWIEATGSRGDARTADSLREWAVLRTVNLRTPDARQRHPSFAGVWQAALVEALEHLPVAPTAEDLENALGAGDWLDHERAEQARAALAEIATKLANEY